MSESNDFKKNIFDFNNICPRPYVAIIGKEEIIKLNIICDLIKHNNNDAKITIFTHDENIAEFYSKTFPGATILQEFDLNFAIKDILDRQASILRFKNDNKIDNLNPKHVVILDNCLSSKGVWAIDPAIPELLYNGKFYNITCISTMQFPPSVNQRFFFDYYFLLPDNTVFNQKMYFDYCASNMFPDFETFKHAFDQLTTDSGSMVMIAKRGVRLNMHTSVFYYKANDE